MLYGLVSNTSILYLFIGGIIPGLLLGLAQMGVIAVQARPERYVEIHHKLVKAIGRCIPVDKVMSIDEVSCSLIGHERTTEYVVDVARRIKESVRTVGDTLRCSIGVGPNTMLAKVAADMEKPDGLTLIANCGDAKVAVKDVPAHAALWSNGKPGEAWSVNWWTTK